jgi:hypothetical protein
MAHNNLKTYCNNFIAHGEIRDPRRDQRHRDNRYRPGCVHQAHLERTYGKGRWRKRKGIATVRLSDGTVREAEVHWFEAHGVGQKDFKVKKVIR